MGRLARIEAALAALQSFNLADGSVTTQKLADQSVTSSKLAQTIQDIVNAVNRFRWRDDIGRIQIDGGGNNASVSYADNAGHASNADNAGTANRINTVSMTASFPAIRGGTSSTIYVTVPKAEKVYSVCTSYLDNVFAVGFSMMSATSIAIRLTNYAGSTNMSSGNVIIRYFNS